MSTIQTSRPRIALTAGASTAALALSALTGCSMLGGQDEKPAATTKAANVVESATTGVDRHPSGAYMEINAVKVRENSIAVAFEAINGHNEASQFNQIPMWLIDNEGNEYKYSAPEQNQKLIVPAGARASGTLVFLGKFSPTATTVTLRTNVGQDSLKDPLSSKDRKYAGMPKMAIKNVEVQR